MAKGPEAFRTISEAADEVGVPQHVLRFWETKFSFIRPMKRAGGRRFYRPADLEVLRSIRRLLHEEGYTIRGVQRLHKEEGPSRFGASSRGKAVAPVGLAASDGAGQDIHQEDRAGSEPAEAPGRPAPTAIEPRDLQPLRQALQELEAAKARLDAVLGPL